VRADRPRHCHPTNCVRPVDILTHFAKRLRTPDPGMIIHDISTDENGWGMFSGPLEQFTGRLCDRIRSMIIPIEPPMSVHLITSPKCGRTVMQRLSPHYFTHFGWRVYLPTLGQRNLLATTFLVVPHLPVSGPRALCVHDAPPVGVRDNSNTLLLNKRKHLWENKDSRDCPKLVMQWLPRNGVLYHYDSALDLRLAQLKNGMVRNRRFLAYHMTGPRKPP